LTRKKDCWVLDSGAGPGVSTRLLLEYGFGRIVALDPSVRLLKFAQSRLGGGFEPVVATAEYLPFKPHSFEAVLTCFSLRDVRDLARSLQEFARAGTHDCLFAIVDVGKPDAPLARAMVGLYIRHIMPVLARLLVRNRLTGNPFRMIVPTFDRLVTNHVLATIVEDKFGSAKLAESLLGGLILLEAVRSTRLDMPPRSETAPPSI
jgi:demethylmenaquinone methyltransferase / 2-methoxy-6-polyprenyl-1,4-benzoquinol methylase